MARLKEGTTIGGRDIIEELDAHFGARLVIDVTGLTLIELSEPESDHGQIVFIGDISDIVTVIFPSIKGVWYIQNRATTGYAIICRHSSGDEVNILQEDGTVQVMSDGTDMNRVTFEADPTIMRTNLSQTMTAKLIAQSNTDYTIRQVRNIIISSSNPSGGENGDIWIKYS